MKFFQLGRKRDLDDDMFALPKPMPPQFVSPTGKKALVRNDNPIFPASDSRRYDFHSNALASVEQKDSEIEPLASAIPASPIETKLPVIASDAQKETWISADSASTSGIDNNRPKPEIKPPVTAYPQTPTVVQIDIKHADDEQSKSQIPAGATNPLEEKKKDSDKTLRPADVFGGLNPDQSQKNIR